MREAKSRRVGSRRMGGRIAAGLVGGYLAVGTIVDATRARGTLALAAMFAPAAIGILIGWLNARARRRLFSVADIWVWGMAGALLCVLAGLALSVAGAASLRKSAVFAFALALGCALAGLRVASGSALLAYAFGVPIQGGVRSVAPPGIGSGEAHAHPD